MHVHHFIKKSSVFGNGVPVDCFTDETTFLQLNYLKKNERGELMTFTLGFKLEFLHSKVFLEQHRILPSYQPLPDEYCTDYKPEPDEAN